MFDDVVITTENEIIKGDKGVYNLNNGTMKIEGNVVLQQGKNFLKGDIADINLNTGVSKLRSYEGKRIGGSVTPDKK